MATLRQWTGSADLTKGVRRYVACGACHSLYSPDDIVAESCSFTSFSGDAPCNTRLYNIAAGNKRKPAKEFAYNSLIGSLQRLFRRPSFEEKINEWRNRSRTPGILYDVYDGFKWNELTDKDGVTFVDDNRSLLLTLNVDWFCPFIDDFPYSCGAMYLTINNLPRSERYKVENVILVGVMLEPKEPQTAEMNRYLKPLVDELRILYTGQMMRTHKSPNQDVRVRAALLMNACDVPAARRTSGSTLTPVSVHATNVKGNSIPWLVHDNWITPVLTLRTGGSEPKPAIMRMQGVGEIQGAMRDGVKLNTEQAPDGLSSIA